MTEEAIKEEASKQGTPVPIVKIDNKSDNFATVVSLEFGDELGELLDTVRLPLSSCCCCEHTVMLAVCTPGCCHLC